MALIITDHDLSAGKTDSLAQGVKEAVRVSLITTGCASTEITVAKVKVAGENGDFYYATTDKGGVAKVEVKGNGTNGDNFLGLNAADFKVELVPSVGSTGTASVDIY